MCSALNEVASVLASEEAWNSLVSTTLGTGRYVPLIPNVRIRRARSSETGQITVDAFPVRSMD